MSGEAAIVWGIPFGFVAVLVLVLVVVDFYLPNGLLEWIQRNILGGEDE